MGHFEVSAAAGDDEDGDVGAFEEAGLVGAQELVGRGVGEGFAEEGDARTLRGLSMDDQLAGDGGGDECSIGGALDLLDGVDGRCGDDGGAVLFDGSDSAGDRLRVDEWTNSVVDEDDVVTGAAGQRGESVGD